MISTLPGKWNPETRHPESYEQEVMTKLRHEIISDDLVPFDRRITTHGDVGQAFRIFTSDEPVSNECAVTYLNERGETMTIATDGSCYHNGESQARAGAGVFVEHGHELNTSVRLPAQVAQSNQSGEIVGALLAVTLADPRTRIIHESDSRTTLDALTRWKQSHEDTGYILQKNASLTRAVIARIRMRQAHTLLRWVKAHNGHPRNEAADRLAAVGAGKLTEDRLCLSIPPEFRVTGAKLSSMTQKLAYKAIRARKDICTPPRPRAVANLDRISSGIRETFGTHVLDETIWTSLRSKHVSRSAAQFMWMAIHDGYMIGDHWLRTSMPDEMKTRALCAVCGECETMTHIILECEARGQQLIWDLLQQTWLHTGLQWYEPCWGTAFGAACAVFKSSNGARKTAMEQLWCILCTEALHLIWKL